MQLNYSTQQNEIALAATESNIFLTGAAGTGKTTCALAMLDHLSTMGVNGNDILILVPQRSLGRVYEDFLQTSGDFNHGIPTISTQSGLAQKLVRLFWPIIASTTDFKQPYRPPVFLNLESSQYYLEKISRPYFEKGYFESVHLEIPRILTQILDNLNKSALVGFPYQEIGTRLKNAWNQTPGHVHAYDEVQEITNEFRQFCYENNLVDFSLQIELFHNHLWPSLLAREYLIRQYPYMIYDNIEEDTPSIHDIVLDWLPKTRGSMVIFDSNAGFRTFLGADPTSAMRIKAVCAHSFNFSGSFLDRSPMEEVETSLLQSLKGEPLSTLPSSILQSISIRFDQFFPEMITSAAEQVRQLVSQGARASDIAILAPYVNDALRFQIQQSLQRHGISVYSHRPSRSLREEPVTHVLLTLAKIAHPQWGLIPSKYDVRQALNYALNEIDPLRSAILTQIIFQPKNDFWLNDISSIRMQIQERIGQYLSEKYQHLVDWLKEYQQDPLDLDIFLARLFGEILSQPGYGFKDNFQAAEVTARLIESIHSFRQSWTIRNPLGIQNISREYIETIEQGVIAALYLNQGDQRPENTVYLAPAYTFLMQNQSVDYQLLLDIGSMGWWQRLMQPLTQPYVLSRNWNPTLKWTDLHEFETNQNTLQKLISGLLKRCNRGVYLYFSSINESGGEERGPLLKAVQRILRNNANSPEIHHV